MSDLGGIILKQNTLLLKHWSLVLIPEQNIRHKLSTWYHLGLRNIATVIRYRSMKRIGYYKYRLPLFPPLCGPFLSDKNGTAGDSFTVSYFSYHKVQVTSPPDWFVNPWNGIRCTGGEQHWADISDFMSELGDIKTVWELSR